MKVLKRLYHKLLVLLGIEASPWITIEGDDVVEATNTDINDNY